MAAMKNLSTSTQIIKILSKLFLKSIVQCWMIRAHKVGPDLGYSLFATVQNTDGSVYGLKWVNTDFTVALLFKGGHNVDLRKFKCKKYLKSSIFKGTFDGC